ncbi:hypothetical protein ABIB57_002389 [Devosia sp. UYZn731]
MTVAQAGDQASTTLINSSIELRTTIPAKAPHCFASTGNCRSSERAHPPRGALIF